MDGEWCVGVRGQRPKRRQMSSLGSEETVTVVPVDFDADALISSNQDFNDFVTRVWGFNRRRWPKPDLWPIIFGPLLEAVIERRPWNLSQVAHARRNMRQALGGRAATLRKHLPLLAVNDAKHVLKTPEDKGHRPMDVAPSSPPSPRPAHVNMCLCEDGKRRAAAMLWWLQLDIRECILPFLGHRDVASLDVVLRCARAPAIGESGWRLLFRSHIARNARDRRNRRAREKHRDTPYWRARFWQAVAQAERQPAKLS